MRRRLGLKAASRLVSPHRSLFQVAGPAKVLWERRTSFGLAEDDSDFCSFLVEDRARWDLSAGD